MRLCVCLGIFVAAVAGFEPGIVRDTLGGNAEPADVEPLQGFEELFIALSRQRQLLPFPVKVITKRRLSTAYSMTGSRLQQHCLAALQGLILIFLQNSACTNRIFRKQIGAAHKNAHLRALRRQGRAHGGNHCRRQSIMDPACEQDLHLFQVLNTGLQQGVHRHGPDEETGMGTNMTAGLPPFQNELSGALLNESLQQTRGWHMQISRYPVGFQISRLARPPPGYDSKCRLNLLDGLELFLTQGQRYEAQKSHAPGQARQLGLGIRQEPADLRSPHDRKGQKRQPASLPDCHGERQDVADPGHGTLNDGVFGPMENRQAGLRGQRPYCFGRLQIATDALPKSGYNASDRAITFPQGSGKGDVLAHGDQTVILICFGQQPDQHGVPIIACKRQRFHFMQLAASGTAVYPEHLIVLSHQHRLAAVEAAPDPLFFRRKGTLLGQPELLAQHHAGGACQARRCRSMRAYSTLNPIGNVQLFAQLLQQHKGG